jgi:hypothetical protein
MSLKGLCHHNMCPAARSSRFQFLSKGNIALCNCLVGRSILGVGSHAWFLSGLPLHTWKTPFSLLTLQAKVRACSFGSFSIQLFIGGELTQLANFVATAFCSIPLTVSIIPRQWTILDARNVVADPHTKYGWNYSKNWVKLFGGN